LVVDVLIVGASLGRFVPIEGELPHNEAKNLGARGAQTVGEVAPSPARIDLAKVILRGSANPLLYPAAKTPGSVWALSLTNDQQSLNPITRNEPVGIPQRIVSRIGMTQFLFFGANVILFTLAPVGMA
jgi:hypothetical protein